MLEQSREQMRRRACLGLIKQTPFMFGWVQFAAVLSYKVFVAGEKDILKEPVSLISMGIFFLLSIVQLAIIFKYGFDKNSSVLAFESTGSTSNSEDGNAHINARRAVTDVERPDLSKKPTPIPLPGLVFESAMI